jgi:hypothetical protein
MELQAFLIGLASGTILGWFLHVLEKRRTRENRRIAHEVDALAKSLEVFNARVDYVLAVNQNQRGWREKYDKYLDLYRVYPYADPTHLADPEVWAAYFEVAETPGVRDRAWAKEVDGHRYAVIKSLEENRAALLR